MDGSTLPKPKSVKHARHAWKHLTDDWELEVLIQRRRHMSDVQFCVCETYRAGKPVAAVLKVFEVGAFKPVAQFEFSRAAANFDSARMIRLAKTILLPTLSVTFAAFCLWLMVRVVNRSERWAKWTAVGTVAAALVAYPLSVWPRRWMDRCTGDDGHFASHSSGEGLRLPEGAQVWAELTIGGKVVRSPVFQP